MTKTNPEKKPQPASEQKAAQEAAAPIKDAEPAAEAKPASEQPQAGNGQADAAEAKVDPATESKALKEEVAALKDALLRSQAETQNVRKRMQAEVSNRYEQGKAQVLEDMITIIDDLERALEVKTDNSKALLDGVSLTLDQFRNVLSRQGLVPIDPASGEKFDPHLHHAISKEETSECEPNTVLRTVMKGYKLQTRVIRPANVVVGIAATPQDTNTNDKENSNG